MDGGEPSIHPLPCQRAARDGRCGIDATASQIARALISSPRTWALEVLAASRDRYRCDYAYHFAPIQSVHIDEMEWLAIRQGVPSFESYDLAHCEFILRPAIRIRIPRWPLGYDAERVVGTARARYVARPESASGAAS